MTTLTLLTAPILLVVAAVTLLVRWRMHRHTPRVVGEPISHVRVVTRGGVRG